MGPKKKVAVRRLADGKCIEPGCGKTIHREKVSGKEHVRCLYHLLKERANIGRLHDARKKQGLCRCGNPVLPHLKKCIFCTFGLPGTWIFQRHARALRKWSPRIAFDLLGEW